MQIENVFLGDEYASYKVDDFFRFQVKCHSKYESFLAFVAFKEKENQYNNNGNYLITLVSLRKPFLLEIEDGTDIFPNV